jgi:hypothetical protein
MTSSLVQMLAHVIGVVALSFVLTVSLQAQPAGLMLSGTVTVSSGSLTSATITVTNVATGQTAQAQTGALGYYSVPNLAPGEYQVSVSAPGFESKVVRVTLGPSVGQAVDLTLSPASGQGGLSLQDLGISPAEAAGNAQEQARLDKRSHMLMIHQRLGLATAVPMLASILTSPGAKIGSLQSTSSPTGREIHSALGAVTAGMYFTTAYFAIRAPKVPGTETRGHIRLHKALAWIHGPGMVLTPTLGAIAYRQESQGQRVHGIASIHSQVAVATFGSFVAAMLSVSVK